MALYEGLRPDQPHSDASGTGDSGSDNREATPDPAAEIPQVESESSTVSLLQLLKKMDERVMLTEDFLQDIALAKLDKQLSADRTNQLLEECRRILLLTRGASKFLISQISRLPDDEDPKLRDRMNDTRKKLKDLSDQLIAKMAELSSSSTESTPTQQPAARPEPRTEAPKGVETYQSEADALANAAQSLLDKTTQGDATYDPTDDINKLRNQREEFMLIMDILKSATTLPQRQAELNYRTNVLPKVEAALQAAAKQAETIDTSRFNAQLTEARANVPDLHILLTDIETAKGFSQDLTQLSKEALVSRQDALNTLIDRAKEIINDPRQPLARFDRMPAYLETQMRELGGEVDKVTAEKTRRFEAMGKGERFEVQSSIYRFMSENNLKVPFWDDDMAERFQGKTLRQYLLEQGVPEADVAARVERIRQNPKEYFSILAISVFNRMITEVWNKEYGKVAHPYTADHEQDPLKGPSKVMILNDTTQSYDPSDKNRAKTFTTFFDQFKFIFPEGTKVRAEAEAFAERMKATGEQISHMHNRAVLFRDNIDPAGPDASLKVVRQLNERRGEYSLDFRVFFDKKGATADTATEDEVEAAKMTETERKFSQAVEFTMGIWAFLSLSRPNRDKLTQYRSPLVAQITDNPDYQNIASTGFGSSSVRVRFIKEVVEAAQQEYGITKQMAELAYHVGESFRIGTAIETALDVQYKPAKLKNLEPMVDRDGTPILDANGNELLGELLVDKAGAPILDEFGNLQYRPEVEVSVPAQENGASKGMFPGGYAEYAHRNPERPDYVETYGKYLFKGYPTYADAWQATHNLRDASGNLIDISGWGDNRATLAELLSVQGAMDTVDWSAGSITSDPDGVVAGPATQSITAIWPKVALSSAKDTKNLFFVGPQHLQSVFSTTVDSYREQALVRQRYGFPNDQSKTIGRLSEFFGQTADLGLTEMLAFETISGDIEQARRDDINKFVKDFRAYWLDPLQKDTDRHPLDVVRRLNALFTRDGRPAVNRGYVHPKIRTYIESVKEEIARTQQELGSIDWDNPQDAGFRRVKAWVDKKIIPLVSGYVTYDVMMGANLELFKPDFDVMQAEAAKIMAHHDAEAHDKHGDHDDGKAAEAKRTRAFLTPEKIRALYDHLDYGNYKGHPLLTVGGFPIMESSKVDALINDALAFRDMYESESNDPTVALRMAGYKLDEYPGEVPKEILGTDGELPPLFTREDLLKYFQKNLHLAEGYRYVLGPDLKGDLENKFIRNNFAYVKPRFGNKEVLKKVDEPREITIQYILDRAALLGRIFGAKKAH